MISERTKRVIKWLRALADALESGKLYLLTAEHNKSKRYGDDYERKGVDLRVVAEWYAGCPEDWKEEIPY